MNRIESLCIVGEPMRIILFAAIGMALLALFVVIITFQSLYRPWMRCFLSRAEVSFFEIVAMRLRRTNLNEVIENRIVSVQAGFPISTVDLERASISKADVQKLTWAYIESNKNGSQFTFEELMDAERKQQLDKMIKQQL